MKCHHCCRKIFGIENVAVQLVGGCICMKCIDYFRICGSCRTWMYRPGYPFKYCNKCLPRIGVLNGYNEMPPVRGFK